MSQEILMRGFFSGMFSLAFAWLLWLRRDQERDLENPDRNRHLYIPLIPVQVLPLFLLVVVVVGTVSHGAVKTAQMTLSMCFGIFLQICLYYLLLLPALPWCRRRINARACAVLWLIPNYLYIVSQNYMRLPEPLVVLSVPGNLAWVLFWLWLAGFCAVLSWKTVQHLLFRRQVLREAQPVTDPETLAIWQALVEESRVEKPKFRLVTSPAVSAPLSIGLWKRSTRVVLPQRRYSPQELTLILKHELIHVAREDAWAKYFLVFCTAMCWFNPLMWIAMKKSAEDLELSCDESVLLEADDATRRRYATLLLDAAGDQRGFTTCLSASAQAMRYRLGHMMNPPKRSSGALVVSVTFFVLSMTSGYVALAYGGKTGEEAIYQSRDHDQFRLHYVSEENNPYSTTYDLTNQEAIHAYLGSLTLSDMTGNYSFSGVGREVIYLMDAPEGTLALTLNDQAIRVTNIYEKNTSERYYIAQGVDWAYLDSIIVARPALEVRLDKAGNTYGDTFPAGLRQLWEGGERVYYEGNLEENPAGLFGDGVYERHEEMTFEFSEPLTAPCTVKVESLDRKSSATFTQEDMSQPFTIPLPQYPARYTVSAQFQGQSGQPLEAEFYFDLSDL